KPLVPFHKYGLNGFPEFVFKVEDICGDDVYYNFSDEVYHNDKMVFNRMWELGQGDQTYTENQLEMGKNYLLDELKQVSDPKHYLRFQKAYLNKLDESNLAKNILGL